MTHEKTEHSPVPWRAYGDTVLRAADGTVVGVITSQIFPIDREFALRAVNSHAALITALEACSFQLATLVAAHGEFTDVNAKALDLASAALAATQKAE